MPKPIEMLITFCKYAYAIAAALGIPGWTYRFVHDVLIANMPLSQSLAICFFGMAATLWLGLGITHWIEFYLQRSGEAKLGSDFAEKLEERINVGDGAWTANDLAGLWAGEGADKETWNRRFRWIKHSVLNGHVQGSPLNSDGHPVRETVIRLKDLAAFFRRKNWKKLAAAPEGFYD